MARLRDFIAFFTFVFLSAPIFGQLEDAAYFSPRKCFSIEAKESFFTKNYYEFAKLYNAPTREKAVENFRNLLKNAKTQEAKAWALFGLRNLGEEYIPKSLENVLLFTGNMGAHKDTVHFYADCDIRIPNKYADIDLKDFELSQSLEAHAKNVLCESGMFATGAIGEGGVLPAEVWAFNYLAKGKSGSEISEIAKDIWERAKNFEGRLYALLLFKKAGNESEFSEHLAQLDPLEKFTEMAGCIVFKNKTLESVKNLDNFFNVKYAFRDSIPEYPPHANPGNKNANRIPLREIKINFKEAEVKEDALGYLPMRFRSKGANFLCGEGLQKLARQWIETKDPSERKTLENILNQYLPPNLPAKFLADCGNYTSPVFVEKVGNKYVLADREIEIGEEACFDPLFYSSTETRKFEKRVCYGLIQSRLSGDKPEDDISLEYNFNYANKVVMESLKIDGLYKKDLEKKLAERFKEEEMLGEFLVLSEFGDDISAFLCPVFTDTPKEQIELLKKQHERYFSALDAKAKERFNLLSKEYKTILDCDFRN